MGGGSDLLVVLLVQLFGLLWMEEAVELMLELKMCVPGKWGLETVL